MLKYDHHRLYTSFGLPKYNNRALRVLNGLAINGICISLDATLDNGILLQIDRMNMGSLSLISLDVLYDEALSLSHLSAVYFVKLTGEFIYILFTLWYRECILPQVIGYYAIFVYYVWYIISSSKISSMLNRSFIIFALR